MRRPALNTIKYTNFTCRTVSRRNRYAGTTPSSATLLPATVRSPFTLRRSYRRRHRLVSFSLKSFRLWRCRCLPIRSPRSVTDEYWHVASAAPIVRRSGGWALPFRAGCREVRESIRFSSAQPDRVEKRRRSGNRCGACPARAEVFARRGLPQECAPRLRPAAHRISSGVLPPFRNKDRGDPRGGSLCLPASRSG